MLLSKLPATERAAAREGAISEAGATWLARKGETAGFSIDPGKLYIDRYERVRVPREDTRTVIFSTVTFQGVLTVRTATVSRERVGRLRRGQGLRLRLDADPTSRTQ